MRDTVLSNFSEEANILIFINKRVERVPKPVFTVAARLFRDYLALKVYVALCYYKLDYYDVSQEVLAVYLQNIPDSTTALNLKACNHYRLYNGKAAEVLSI